jgi:guanylate kinase
MPTPSPQPGPRGHLFIISAPSGAGKSTLGRLLRRRCPELAYSISSTTRAPRPGEVDGTDYFFVDPERFRRGIANGEWAEWAEVHGNWYGTSRAVIDGALEGGRDLLLDIDVQGAAQIVERYPDAVTIFIRPPSLDVLRRRLVGRATDSPAAIRRRLEDARTEMACQERYRHVVVNDHLEDALEELVAIIRGYRAATLAGEA